MIKKIALIPLDDRPCNAEFPVKVGKIAGVQVVTPPKEILGKYLDPGSPEKLHEWLKRSAADVDAVVISSDMLCFGGLIASRISEIPLGKAKENLLVLGSIKKENPHLKIYLSSIIMRLSITCGADTEEYWDEIFEYSILLDRIEILSDPEDKKKIKNLKKKIPKGLLDEYLKARERNHEINKLVVELVQKGIVDRLFLGLEDAAEYGIHRKELRSLEEQISKGSEQDKVSVLCGADELGMMQTVRLIMDPLKARPKIYIEYSDPESQELVSLYEDRSIHKTAIDHVKALGGVEVKEIDSSDLILFIHSPDRAQQDLFLKGKIERDEISLKKLKNKVLELKRLLGSGKPVALADIAYANGADPEFVKILLEYVDLPHLTAFAAWNTSGNSIGCALSQAFAFLALREENRAQAKKMNLEFLLERFIDDWLYQSILRERIKSDLKDKVSVFNLGKYYTEIDWVVKQELLRSANEIFEKHFKGTNGIHSMKCNVSLPWPRIFEVDVDVKFS